MKSSPHTRLLSLFTLPLHIVLAKSLVDFYQFSTRHDITFSPSHHKHVISKATRDPDIPPLQTHLPTSTYIACHPIHISVISTKDSISL